MKDEYVRKQDAIDAFNRAVQDVGILDADDIETVFGMLSSADVVQVVLCRDCEHYYFADNRIPQEQRYVCEISGEIWKPDDFCSFGKRREE